MIHELKTDPEMFKAVHKGVKTYEIRRNDRNYKEGDELLLKETVYTGEEMSQGAELLYTGRSLSVLVVHVLHGPVYGLVDDWCIMSVCWGHINRVEQPLKDADEA